MECSGRHRMEISGAVHVPSNLWTISVPVNPVDLGFSFTNFYTPSVHYLSIYFYIGKMEPIAADFLLEAGFTGLTQRDSQPFTLTFTPLSSQFCMSLGCRKKPECPEETHKGTLLNEAWMLARSQRHLLTFGRPRRLTAPLHPGDTAVWAIKILSKTSWHCHSTPIVKKAHSVSVSRMHTPVLYRCIITTCSITGSRFADSEDIPWRLYEGHLQRQEGFLSLLPSGRRPRSIRPWLLTSFHFHNHCTARVRITWSPLRCEIQAFSSVKCNCRWH